MSTKNKNKFKICAISDTHLLAPNLAIPNNIDLLIHAGDATMSGRPEEIIKFNNWLGSLFLKKEQIIFVPGNHDRLFEKDYGLAINLMTNATVLIDGIMEVNGLKIFGCPWSLVFGHNWVFNKWEHQMDDYVRNVIPNNIDILITHGPAFQIGDLTLDNDNAGSKNIRRFMEKSDTQLLICGHIHEDYSYNKIENKHYVNAAILDRSYKPTHNPWIIEFEDGKVKKISNDSQSKN